MIIPKKLKIGGHLYKIVNTKDKFDSGTCGIQSRLDSEIVINKDLPNSHQATTLFHEIFHAMNGELDHTILESLSEQLYQVLSDNKLLK